MYGSSIADLLERTERECQRLARLDRPLTTEEEAFVRRMRDAAENTLEPLLCGLEALGELMTVTLSADEVMPKKTVSGLGWLLVSMAGALEKSWRIHHATGRIVSPSG